MIPQSFSPAPSIHFLLAKHSCHTEQIDRAFFFFLTVREVIEKSSRPMLLV